VATRKEDETMRLTERSMLRIAEDLRADDLLGTGPDDGETSIDHRRWIHERTSAPIARLEHVRFRVGWAGRIWRIRSLGGRA
jgi:hypothetical protein